MPIAGARPARTGREADEGQMSIDLPSGVARRAGRVLQRPQGPQHRLSGRALRGRRVSRLWRGQQRHRQSAARAYRLRLRLLGQHRRLRHQPDADRLRFGDLDLWPRLLGRPAQYAAGRRPRHRVRDHPRLRHRHRAAVEELAGGARPPPAMSRPSAISRCCCNCCSGTTPCSRRCRRCATASRSRAAAFSTIAACSCRSRSSEPASASC